MGMVIMSTASTNNNMGWATIRCSFQSLAALLVALLIVGAVYMAGEGEQLAEDELKRSEINEGYDNISSNTSCNLFDGKWVFDNVSYPLYNERECTFMSDQLACQKFGRKDSGYQHWRWQPHSCDLPRFNGTNLLERLRNKRLVFVGDSLNRGQWVSMVCLAETVVRDPALKSIHHNGSLITFTAHEYNATIEFYWAPLLVESNSDDPVMHRLPDRIVRVKAIEDHARHWTHADILIFNTYLWWRRSTMNVLWGSFDDGNGIYKDIEMLRAYELALETWAEWLEIHVDHNRTRSFFVSMSPTHEWGEEWGRADEENCYGETEPITKEGYTGSGTDPKMMKVVEDAINNLEKRGIKVQMINITQLSEYRKDGHPSIYRKQWDPPTEEQLAKPTSYSDCIHWCLPGIPDVWNQLLYAHLF
ncbi:protein trichome birefringence-like 34 [Impatiens glandulifera]|uniref:protein trichome birefringence-like 34 n=1 Tax=Impatiens glandulifera TaxID=253017 RepID=UPI001FB0BD49|nr:protein trichome birefringence-like 34 [Impatiens glandulifera]